MNQTHQPDAQTSPKANVQSKIAIFHALHAQGCFVMPNAWDAGSARLLEALGFQAIGSSGAGLAWSYGQSDGNLNLADVLRNAEELARAVNIPVNVDFENGFAEDERTLRNHIKALIQTGIAGFSLEDSLHPGQLPLRSPDEAARRIEWARNVIEQAGTKTLLVGRAENFFSGDPNLDDVILRLKHYANAGADCVYAPGLRTREQIQTVVQAVAPTPVNVLIGWETDLTVQDLKDMCVRRISVGGALARAAWKGFLEAAREIGTLGSFGGFTNTPSAADLHALFDSVKVATTDNLHTDDNQ